MDVGLRDLSHNALVAVALHAAAMSRQVVLSNAFTRDNIRSPFTLKPISEGEERSYDEQAQECLHRRSCRPVVFNRRRRLRGDNQRLTSNF